MKWSQFYRIAVFPAILLFFSTSCTKEEPNLSDYKGTWSAVEPISIPGKVTPHWHIITFTESTFFDALQVEVPEEELLDVEFRREVWTDSICAKGSISFNGDMLTRTTSEIGIYFFSVDSGFPKHDWEIFTKDQEKFDLLLLEWGLTKTTVSKITVLDHQLTLQTDLNMDGDYEDEHEKIVYKKDSKAVRF